MLELKLTKEDIYKLVDKKFGIPVDYVEKEIGIDNILIKYEFEDDS